MKRTLTALAGLALAACCGSDAMAFRGGPPAGFSGSNGDGGLSCILCHGLNKGAGSVEILGVPDSYEANEIYDLTVRIADPAQAAGGFEITVEDSEGTKVGTLMLVDPTLTQFAEGLTEWVSHTEAGVNNAANDWISLGSAAEYQVRWQAPAMDLGPITFYAAGNAVNNDMFSTGDNIYLTTVTANTFGSGCAADLDGDGQVNSADLALMLGSWGGGPGAADLDDSGDVGSSDLALLLGAWGPC